VKKVTRQSSSVLFDPWTQQDCRPSVTGPALPPAIALFNAFCPTTTIDVARPISAQALLGNPVLGSVPEEVSEPHVEGRGVPQDTEVIWA